MKRTKQRPMTPRETAEILRGCILQDIARLTQEMRDACASEDEGAYIEACEARLTCERAYEAALTQED